MQIFELTAGKKTLKEYDPNRSPQKKNFGTGVGPGVQPQYTATPRMKATPTPAPAPRLPAPSTGAVTPAAPKLQTIDAPAQLPAPTAAKQLGTNYDSNVIDVEAKPKLNKPALPAPSTTPAPTAAPAPAAPAPAPTAAPAPASVPTTPEVNVTSATSKSALPPTPPPLKFDPLGSAVKALTAHNANQSGVGFLNKDNHIPKVRQNAVTGAILVDGEPYNPKNPVHVNAYREWTYGHRGSERIETNKEGQVTINGKPYDANNPEHVKAYKNHLNPTAKPIVPAKTPPATAPTNARPGTPSEPSGVEQALMKLGYSPQGAAAMAAKVPPGMSEQDAIKLALSGQLRESLTWSRSFDPSRTLLKKIRQL